MLHTDHPTVRSRLLQGRFGLEKESLRITQKGFMAHTPHPFSNSSHIVRDFCENQTEINTPVVNSPHEAVESLARYTRRIQRTLSTLPEPELLWPFSNPPYIQDEEDIPIAQFSGEQASKTKYREYLSIRYGRYKMVLSGIHFNYSFHEELLKADFALSGESDFAEYKNRFYVELAEKAAAYGWLITAATAASPLLDRSYVEKGKQDGAVFNGMASVRCSEVGYWNYFAPIFDYSSVRNYADSIQSYVENGLIRFPSELYYPIRLKPNGPYSLETLREQGVNHIELRMVDLNPLAPAGVEEKDVRFGQLFLVWLASLPRCPLDIKAQVQAVQNFKNAAHYDLKTVRIVTPDGSSSSVAGAALAIIRQMQDFYAGFPQEIQDTLAFELDKFLDAENRYAWQLRRSFGIDFVKNALELAKNQQNTMIQAAP